jgi:glycogen debranching enzyme
MLSDVKVGPLIITINQGSTFMVTTPDGEIMPDAELGLFVRDTRLISSYRLFIQGQSWTLATSAAVSYYGARYVFVSPSVRAVQGSISERQLELKLERTVCGGVHEDFDISNYSTREASFHFELAIASDFADLFEVKAHEIVRRGAIDTVWDTEKSELASNYHNQGFLRGVIYQLHCAQTKPHFANGRILFDITLPPGGTWHACGHIIPVLDGVKLPPQYGCHKAVAAGDTEADRLQRLWHETTTKVITSNHNVQRGFDQGVYDLGALRLYEQDVSDELWIPAAGVPWFVTVFGRDSLVGSLQTMLVNCWFACGSLKRLSALQATERDDWRDAQPGKILHEIRSGELAHFKLVPHIPYYGTADATLLFLILLSEAFRWTGDEGILREHRDAALRCLEWIDRDGDLDGDGFQEYKTFSPQGYHNMGWKDAVDAVVYPDGSQVAQPIATCELQGYAYDAKLRMARVFEFLGESATARQLQEDADALKRRFNEAFWMEDEGFYAYALDPKKDLVRSIASNAGHLLWSGIVDSSERASRVTQRLLAPDMFSGWGIRTLSKDNPAYNPHSYQLGSVWPHDNALIAAGAKRYGLWREANEIARSIFDASAAFQSCRLPELFAGLDRTPGSFPVQYIGANIPQAWAAGSVFMLLQTILGLSANAPEKAVHFHPMLPEWLADITLSNLRFGKNSVSVRFTGSGDATSCEILENEGGLRVTTGPGTAVPPARLGAGPERTTVLLGRHQVGEVSACHEDRPRRQRWRRPGAPL